MVDERSAHLTRSVPTPGVINQHVTSGGVALVTIKSPSRLNALSANMRRELIATLEELDSAAHVRAIILTGDGRRAFSAGADLTEAKGYSAADAATWAEEWVALFRTILSLETPTLAALNGYAIGGALQVAMMCDFRIASTTAKAGMLEINDAIPCVTGTWALSGILGRGQISELVLTGRLLTADDMQGWGMVTQVVSPDRLMAVAQSLAESLASKDPLTLRLDKEGLRRDLLERLPAALDGAKRAHATAFESGTPQKVMEAFLSRST